MLLPANIAKWQADIAMAATSPASALVKGFLDNAGQSQLLEQFQGRCSVLSRISRQFMRFHCRVGHLVGKLEWGDFYLGCSTFWLALLGLMGI